MASTLVVNPGSSSRKYALYVDGKAELEICFEQTNTGFQMCSRVVGTQQICEAVDDSSFETAFSMVADEVNNYLVRLSAGKRLDNIVVRIVAPGTYFQKHAEINEEYVTKLQQRESSAPLHIPVILREIRSAKKYFPTVKLLAASDSAFHSTMPKIARNYSLPSADLEQYDIYRFGYHGLSVSSVVRRIHSIIGLYPENVVVCHIGNGTSLTAVKNGKSVETTMGFSPSTGLPMGTRAGDVDSAVVLELQRVKNLLPSEAELYINTNGGLQGMSGVSDIRMLLERRSQFDETAIQALDKFAYHIQKAVASMTIALGGLDVLIFTATAAVRSSALRELVTSKLKHIGVVISPDRNELMVGKDGVISVRNSPIKVVVMRTDEMGEMAHVGATLGRNS